VGLRLRVKDSTNLAKDAIGSTPSRFVRGKFRPVAERPDHKCNTELRHERRILRAHSVFERLALPTSASISNGIRSR
jgi:hypothetical protein